MNEEKKDWLLVVTNRKQDLFTIYGWSTGMRDKMDELIGEHVKNVMLIGSNKIYDGYYSKSELVSDLGNRILSILKEDESFIEKHLNDFNKRFNALIDNSRELSRTDLEHLNNKEIGKLFLKYYEAFRELSPFMNIPHTVENFANERIKDFLRKKLAEINRLDELNQYFNKLAISSDETFETRHRKELIKIAVEINKNDNMRNLFTKEQFEKGVEAIIDAIKASLPYVLDNLKNYCDEWGWVGTQNYIYPPYDMEHTLLMIHEILQADEPPLEQLKRLEKQRTEMIKNAEKVLEELKPDESTKKIIEILQNYVFLRTHRMEGFRKAYFFSRHIYYAIGKKMGLNDDETMVLTPDEIIRFLEKGDKAQRAELRKRLEACAFVMKDNNIQLYSGKDDVEAGRLEELGTEEAMPEVLEGIGIYPGTVEGRVCIIKSKDGLDKFEKGDILVTTMTMPDYATAISKASGIITDEGGMTSHAAIISREMGIPCVIGTKYATRMLKDNDKVVINSTDGIIKKVV